MSVAQSFLKIFVADLDRSAAFYVDVLGLVEGGRMAAPEFDELILRAPKGGTGGSIVLCRWRDGRALERGNVNGAIGFSVADVDAVHESGAGGGRN